MNKSLKRGFVISFCLFCAFPPSPEADEPLKRPPPFFGLFSFSLETTVGFLYGQGEEIVYKNNSDKYLSELLWDLKPLLYYGAALSFEARAPSWPVGFYTDLSVKMGISGRSGIIEDRDWLHKEKDYMTHYSRHDNYIEDARFFDWDLGAAFRLNPGGAFNPALSLFWRFSYMELRWLSRDGYIQYGANSGLSGSSLIPWEDSFSKSETPGPGIQYTQMWILASPGVAASFPISSFFALDCAFTVSPFIRAAAEDLHLLKNTQFEDSIQGGLALEPEIRVFFFPNSRCSLSLRVSWRSIRGTKGYSRFKTAGAETYSPGGASGAGFHALDTGISFKVYF
ncbi:MAG: omptin family outer membrane protease [Treponema sp.]|jgi:outer membrane protease|nr:omptin family outer membrane protease [Treponema sp.]